MIRRLALPSRMHLRRSASSRGGRSARALMLASWRWAFGAAALVVCAGTASASESWGVPDYRELDKQAHFAAGAAIGAVAAVAAERCAPHWRPWQRVLAGVGAAAVLGTVHELLKPHARNRDPKDAIATAEGGIAGAGAVELVFRF